MECEGKTYIVTGKADNIDQSEFDISYFITGDEIKYTYGVDG